MSPLAVNLAMRSAAYTGIHTYATSVVPHLAPLDPLVLAPEPLPGLRSRTVPASLSAALGTKSQALRLAWTQFVLPGLLAAEGIDALFSPLPEAPVGAAIRSVVVFHDAIPLRFGAPGSNLVRYHRHWVGKVLHAAEHVVCNSRSTLEDARRFHDVPSWRLTAIPLALDHARFRPPAVAPEVGDQLLFVGRRDPHKNLATLLRALALARPETGLGLRLIGPGSAEHDAELKALAAELGLADAVEFSAWVPHEALPVAYASAFAVVVPSRWEGFGLPVLEAMACGAPVLCSTGGALPEVAGDAALTFDPDDVGALADAIRRLHREPRLRAELCRAGLKRAAGFTWERTGAETASLVRRVLLEG